MSKFTTKLNDLKILFMPTQSSELWATLVVDVGSMQDQQLKGLAHFVEHMLIHSIRNKGVYDAPILGTTYFDMTTYRIKCHNQESIVNAIRLLEYILYGEYLTKTDMSSAEDEVSEESVCLPPVEYSLNYVLHEIGLDEHIPIGNLNCVHKFTYDDVTSFHKNNYLKSRAALIVAGSQNKIASQILLENHKTLTMDKISSLCIPPISNYPIYIFNGTNRNISIYYHNVHSSSVANDISFALIENFLDEYLLKSQGIVSTASVSTILFDQKNMFMRIDCSFDFTTTSQSTIIESIVSNGLFNFICSELTDEKYKNFIDEYVKNIEYLDAVTNESATMDAACSFTYNTPLFLYDKYIPQVCMLNREEVLSNLYFWIYRKEYRVISSMEENV